MSLTKVTYSMIENGVFDVKNYGAVGDGSTNDTAAIQAAFNAVVAAGGGTLLFPKGEYAFNLDVSGTNPRMDWVGQGDVTFYPASNSAANSSIITANNTTGAAGSFKTTNITFRNIQFVGRYKTDVDPVYGRVNYCVSLLSSAAVFYDCSFNYALMAGFYGYFGQYNEFYSCEFGSCIATPASTGCLLVSNTATEAANDNTFIRCKFLTNKNGFVLKGGLNNRLYACTFIGAVFGGAYGALGLDEDDTGFTSNSTVVSGCYFEANSGDITINLSENALFEGNVFLPALISSQTCYNLSFIGNNVYGGGSVVDLNHPALNSDTASLTWIGNNFDANTEGIIHAGPSRFAIDNAQTGISRNDNVLIITGQTETNTGAVLVAGTQYGFKGNIARTVATPIFSISQQTYASSYARYSAFELVVQAVNDPAVSTSFGYACRIEKFQVFITNNTTGAPQVYITTLSGGTNIGIDAATAAIGTLTLTSSVSGQDITFSLSYAGSGTTLSVVSSINAGYTINYTGANPVVFTRL